MVKFYFIVLMFLCTTLTGQEVEFNEKTFQNKLNNSVNFYREILENSIQDGQIDTVLCQYRLWLGSDTLEKINISSYEKLYGYLQRLDSTRIRGLKKLNGISSTLLLDDPEIFDCSCSAYDANGNKLTTMDTFGNSVPVPETRQDAVYWHDYMMSFYGSNKVLIDHVGSLVQLVNGFWNAVWSPTEGLLWYKVKEERVDTLFTTEEAMLHKKGRFRFITYPINGN